LKNFEYISKEVGLPIEYTQGGGGNTSVKLNDELMAVKASGYKLKQITPEEGYVVVNYKNIFNYYMQVDLDQEKDYEAESAEMVKTNIVEVEGLKKLRPSVEAGFHSLLQKYVIHTHPVYANLICCAHNGRDLMDEIFSNVDFGIVWIPYIDPGFSLTLRIRDALEQYKKENGQEKIVQIILMENHGLITTSNDSEECVALHKKANELIKEYFEIKEPYPQMQISKIEENKYISRTGYLTDYFKSHKIDNGFFDRIVLYPDQLVYLNGSLSVSGMDNKLNINSQTGEIIYLTNASEAQTMEESMLAYVYIIDQMEKLGIPTKSMNQSEINFIANWEGEKYRKSLVKNLEK
jgi:ribulose-5-phosphate 4-epimerase/fuculose-1-phosphate aldolase